jgi:lambda family phage portal protein
MYMNNPVATAVVKRLTTNVVGTGINLQCRIDRGFLNLTDENARQWERNTERKYRAWANTTECDAEQFSTFRQLQWQAFFNMLLSGDCFIILNRYSRNGRGPQLRLKLVEADECVNPNNQFDTNKIAGGVEVDTHGAPVRYYFKQRDPGTALGSNMVTDWKAIKPFSPSGRRQLIQLFVKERPGQRRGMPILAPVIEELKNITRLTKAELDAAVINAFFTVFVKSESGGESLADGFVPGGAGVPGQVANPEQTGNAADAYNYEMGSGNIVDLAEGEDITLADPQRPNKNYTEFYHAIVEQIGAETEIPYEILLQHFSSSYSASRGAILEAGKAYRTHRERLNDQVNQVVYYEWLADAILDGRIQAPGFFDSPEMAQAWAGTYWSGMGQGLLRPVEETEAALMRIEGNISTNEEEYAAIHDTGDWEAALSRKASENELILDKGLEIYSKNKGRTNAKTAEAQRNEE